MRRIRFVVSLTVLIILLAPTTVVIAKGPPAKATISGPGLQGEIEITDPTLLNALSFFQFEQVEENNRRGIDQPANPGEGYLITRYIQRAPGSPTFQPWDQLHYYPNAEGGRSVIFLDGLIGDSSTEFDGKWYNVSPDGDAAMRAFLTDRGALTPAQTLPATGTTAPATMLYLVPAALLVLTGLALRRRVA